MAEPTGSNVRIGTAERERAAADLGEHYSAGRLTAEEFEERVRLAYQAKIGGDLEPLFADLPPLHPPAEPAGQRRIDLRMVLIVMLVAASIAFVVVTQRAPFFIFPLFWVFIGMRRYAHHRF